MGCGLKIEGRQPTPAQGYVRALWEARPLETTKCLLDFSPRARRLWGDVCRVLQALL